MHDGGRPLTADAISRLAIVRPLPAGRRARVTLGIARVAYGDAEGYGFYEYGRVL